MENKQRMENAIKWYMTNFAEWFFDNEEPSLEDAEKYYQTLDPRDYEGWGFRAAHPEDYWYDKDFSEDELAEMESMCDKYLYLCRDKVWDYVDTYEIEERLEELNEFEEQNGYLWDFDAREKRMLEYIKDLCD